MSSSIEEDDVRTPVYWNYDVYSSSSQCNPNPCFNCSSNSSSSSSDFPYETYHLIVSYYIMFIVVFGTFGNCLSATVFMRTALRKRPSSYYLTALAVSDTGYLINLLCSYLNDLLKLNFFRFESLCKFHIYASSVFTSLSTWIIVSFTVERFIAIQYPLHRPIMSTVRRAKFIILFISIVALAVNVVPLFAVGFINEVCDIIDDYRHIYGFYTVADTVWTLIVPAALIVLMNTIISIRLSKFSRFYNIKHIRMTKLIFSISTSRWKSRSSVTNSTSCNNSRKNSSSNNNSINGSTSSPEIRRGCRHNTILLQRKQRNVTKMLLTVSTVFIVLNLPSYSIRFYIFWTNCQTDLLAHLQYFFMILFYTNFSINFLLYSTCGVSFRRALLSLGRRNLRMSCACYENCRMRFRS